MTTILKYVDCLNTNDRVFKYYGNFIKTASPDLHDRLVSAASSGSNKRARTPRSRRSSTARNHGGDTSPESARGATNAQLLSTILDHLNNYDDKDFSKVFGLVRRVDFGRLTGLERIKVGLIKRVLLYKILSNASSSKFLAKIFNVFHNADTERRFAHASAPNPDNTLDPETEKETKRIPQNNASIVAAVESIVGGPEDPAKIKKILFLLRHYSPEGDRNRALEDKLVSVLVSFLAADAAEDDAAKLQAYDRAHLVVYLIMLLNCAHPQHGRNPFNFGVEEKPRLAKERIAEIVHQFNTWARGKRLTAKLPVINDYNRFLVTARYRFLRFKRLNALHYYYSSDDVSYLPNFPLWFSSASGSRGSKTPRAKQVAPLRPAYSAEDSAKRNENERALQSLANACLNRLDAYVVNKWVFGQAPGGDSQKDEDKFEPDDKTCFAFLLLDPGFLGGAGLPAGEGAPEGDAASQFGYFEDELNYGTFEDIEKVVRFRRHLGLMLRLRLVDAACWCPAGLRNHVRRGAEAAEDEQRDEDKNVLRTLLRAARTTNLARAAEKLGTQLSFGENCKGLEKVTTQVYLRGGLKKFNSLKAIYSLIDVLYSVLSSRNINREHRAVLNAHFYMHALQPEPRTVTDLDRLLFLVLLIAHIVREKIKVYVNLLLNIITNIGVTRANCAIHALIFSKVVSHVSSKYFYVNNYFLHTLVGFYGAEDARDAGDHKPRKLPNSQQSTGKRAPSAELRETKKTRKSDLSFVMKLVGANNAKNLANPDLGDVFDVNQAYYNKKYVLTSVLNWLLYSAGRRGGAAGGPDRDAGAIKVVDLENAESLRRLYGFCYDILGFYSSSLSANVDEILGITINIVLLLFVNHTHVVTSHATAAAGERAEAADEAEADACGDNEKLIHTILYTHLLPNLHVKVAPYTIQQILKHYGVPDSQESSGDSPEDSARRTDEYGNLLKIFSNVSYRRSAQIERNVLAAVEQSSLRDFRYFVLFLIYNIREDCANHNLYRALDLALIEIPALLRFLIVRILDDFILNGGAPTAEAIKLVAEKLNAILEHNVAANAGGGSAAASGDADNANVDYLSLNVLFYLVDSIEARLRAGSAQGEPDGREAADSPEKLRLRAAYKLIVLCINRVDLFKCSYYCGLYSKCVYLMDQLMMSEYKNDEEASHIVEFADFNEANESALIENLKHALVDVHAIDNAEAEAEARGLLDILSRCYYNLNDVVTFAYIQALLNSKWGASGQCEPAEHLGEAAWDLSAWELAPAANPRTRLASDPGRSASSDSLRVDLTRLRGDEEDGLTRLLKLNIKKLCVNINTSNHTTYIQNILTLYTLMSFGNAGHEAPKAVGEASLVPPKATLHGIAGATELNVKLNSVQNNIVIYEHWRKSDRRRATKHLLRVYNYYAYTHIKVANNVKFNSMVPATVENRVRTPGGGARRAAAGGADSDSVLASIQALTKYIDSLGESVFARGVDRDYLEEQLLYRLSRLYFENRAEYHKLLVDCNRALGPGPGGEEYRRLYTNVLFYNMDEAEQFFEHLARRDGGTHAALAQGARLLDAWTAGAAAKNDLAEAVSQRRQKPSRLTNTLNMRLIDYYCNVDNNLLFNSVQNILELLTSCSYNYRIYYVYSNYLYALLMSRTPGTTGLSPPSTGDRSPANSARDEQGGPITGVNCLYEFGNLLVHTLNIHFLTLVYYHTACDLRPAAADAAAARNDERYIEFIMVRIMYMLCKYTISTTLLDGPASGTSSKPGEDDSARRLALFKRMNAVVSFYMGKFPVIFYYVVLNQIVGITAHKLLSAVSVAVLGALLRRYTSVIPWFLTYFKYSNVKELGGVYSQIVSNTTGGEPKGGRAEGGALSEADKLRKLSLAREKNTILYYSVLFGELYNLSVSSDSNRINAALQSINKFLNNINSVQAAQSPTPRAGARPPAGTIVVPDTRNLAYQSVYRDAEKDFVHSLSNTVAILSSKQKPKVITFNTMPGTAAAEGGRRSFLLKNEQKGDLRKDLRTLDCVKYINRLIEGRLRYQLRLFMIIVITEVVGMIEFVPNLTTLKSLYVFSISPDSVDDADGPPVGAAQRKLRREEHKQKMREVNRVIGAYIKQINAKDYAASYASYNRILNNLSYRHNSILSFCVHAANDVGAASKPGDTAPAAVSAQVNAAKPAAKPGIELNYHRLYTLGAVFNLSCAIWNVFGYILGLGDRHTENILLDFKSGDVLHVDFDCIFDKGLKLLVPELVPHRLTPIIINNLGRRRSPAGVTSVRTNGLYFTNCTRFFRLLLAHGNVIKLILYNFILDPMIKWSNITNRINLKLTNHINTYTTFSAGGQDPEGGFVPEDGAAGRAAADVVYVNEPVNVDLHVQELIRAATNKHLLSRMFVGWAPWI